MLSKLLFLSLILLAVPAFTMDSEQGTQGTGIRGGGDVRPAMIS